MSTHAGNPRTCERLKKVLELLRSRGLQGATTMEIIELCKVCAVNSIVHELRYNGYAITCKTSCEGGARVARYKLVEAPPASKVG